MPSSSSHLNACLAPLGTLKFLLKLQPARGETLQYIYISMYHLCWRGAARWYLVARAWALCPSSFSRMHGLGTMSAPLSLPLSLLSRKRGTPSTSSSASTLHSSRSFSRSPAVAYFRFVCSEEVKEPTTCMDTLMGHYSRLNPNNVKSMLSYRKCLCFMLFWCNLR